MANSVLFCSAMIFLILLCVTAIILLALSFTIWKKSPEVRPTKSCYTDADCDPELECSHENVCVPKPCESNQDCENGKVCDTSTKTCIQRRLDSIGTCKKFSPLCTDGSVCIDSKCYYCDESITECPNSYTCNLQNGLCHPKGEEPKLDYCCDEDNEYCYEKKYRCGDFTWCCPENQQLVLLGAGSGGADIMGCPSGELTGTYTVGCIDSDGNKCYATWAEHGTCQQGGNVPKR